MLDASKRPKVSSLSKTIAKIHLSAISKPVEKNGLVLYLSLINSEENNADGLT